jgi:hypothetical protein
MRESKSLTRRAEERLGFLYAELLAWPRFRVFACFFIAPFLWSPSHATVSAIAEAFLAVSNKIKQENTRCLENRVLSKMPALRR